MHSSNPTCVSGVGKLEHGDQCCAMEGGTFASPFPDLINAPYNTVIHASCVCNEIAALRLRVFRVTPTPQPKAMALFRRQRKMFARAFIQRFGRVTPLSVEETVRRFPVAKRRLYTAAAESLARVQIGPRDAAIKMFVKADKCDDAAKKVHLNKPLKPRAIQARGPRYNVALGRYIKAFEGKVCAMSGWRSPTKTQMFAKGLTQQQLARLFVKKLEGFNNPCVVSLDATSFDSSIKIEHLRSLHALYESLCPDAEMQRLLSWRLVNRGTSAHGVRYKVQGGRMSGDVDTALGNCIDMCCLVATVMRTCRVHKWDILDNGDDCLVITEQGRMPDVSVIKECMKSLGIDCDPEVAGSRLEDVEFCRSRIVRTAAGLTWMPRPRRFLANFAVSHTQYNGSQGDYRRTIRSMAYCMLLTYPGTPIISEVAQVVYDALSDVELANNFMTQEYSYKARVVMRNGRTSPLLIPVTDEARKSVERAFAMPEEEQEAIVAEFRRVVQTLFTSHTFEHRGHAALPIEGTNSHVYFQATGCTW